MSTNDKHEAAEVAGSCLLASTVLLGGLTMVLDFFDVSFFDGAGPGACLVLVGLGLLSETVGGLRTGHLFWGRSFVSRDVFPPLYWISAIIYVLASITFIVVGILMLGPFRGL